MSLTSDTVPVINLSDAKYYVPYSEIQLSKYKQACHA